MGSLRLLVRPPVQPTPARRRSSVPFPGSVRVDAAAKSPRAHVRPEPRAVSAVPGQRVLARTSDRGQRHATVSTVHLGEAQKVVEELPPLIAGPQRRVARAASRLTCRSTAEDRSAAMPTTPGRSWPAAATPSHRRPDHWVTCHPDPARQLPPCHPGGQLAPQIGGFSFAVLRPCSQAISAADPAVRACAHSTEPVETAGIEPASAIAQEVASTSVAGALVSLRARLAGGVAWSQPPEAVPGSAEAGLSG
jgi:hypothetical protein